MTDFQTERKQSPDGAPGAAAMFNPAAALSALLPIAQFGARLLDHWLAVNAELIRFGQSRIGRNLEIASASTRLGSYADAMAWQADYINSMVGDYSAEFRRLGELGVGTLLGQLSPPAPAPDDAKAAAQAVGEETAQNRSADLDAPQKAALKNGHDKQVPQLLQQIERRRFPRIEIDRAVRVERLSQGGNAVAARLLNLSQGGAAIRVRMAVEDGEEIGMLGLSDEPLFGRVVQARNGVVRMQFRPDEATPARVAKLVAAFAA